MIYFAYGALGLIDVTRDMWIKESLRLSPSELAGIGVWLGLPWTVKMVFGQLVDSVPIFGSQRRSYILIGAALTACGMLVLAAAAAGTLQLARPEHAYLLGSLLIVIGTLAQDVVADAMSTEVVPRTDDAGNPRPDHDIRAELGLVQVLGRLALSFGILAVAGASGWLASFLGRPTVFLLGLTIPVISVIGVFLIRAEQVERHALDWRILGGGIAFGALVVALGVSAVPLAQEVIFALSMIVICIMLVLVTRELDARGAARDPLHQHHHLRIPRDTFRRRRLFLVDARRPEVRRSVLRHAAPDRRDPRDRRDVGLQQTAHRILGRRRCCSGSPSAGALLSLPNIGLFYGLHEWTEANVRLRRAHHRDRRYRGRLSLRAAFA